MLFSGGENGGEKRERGKLGKTPVPIQLCHKSKNKKQLGITIILTFHIIPLDFFVLPNCNLILFLFYLIFLPHRDSNLFKYLCFVFCYIQHTIFSI